MLHNRGGASKQVTEHGDTEITCSLDRESDSSAAHQTNQRTAHNSHLARGVKELSVPCGTSKPGQNDGRQRRYGISEMRG